MFVAIAALILLLAPAARALPNRAPQSAAAVPASPAMLAKPTPVLVAVNNVDADGAGLETMTAESSAASFQTSQSLSTINVPDTIPTKPIQTLSVENAPSYRNWLILSVAQHGAAAFDAYSTRRAVSRGAVEGDPLMRPFANSPAMYAAIQAGPLALDYVARRMQRSPNRILQRTWWLPQVVSVGLFLFSGAHNMTVANP